jgi:tRNA A-37 threonylcarbamoyl transferase component Bud32
MSHAQRLGEGTITRRQFVAEVLLLAKNVAPVIAGVHAKGVTHRDLTLNNLIIEKQPSSKIKIIDFGCAKKALKGMTALTGTVS